MPAGGRLADGTALSCDSFKEPRGYCLSKLASAVNRVLAPLNIALTRRTTLQNTRIQLFTAQSQMSALRSEIDRANVELQGLKESLEARQAGAIDTIAASHKELLRHQIANRWSVVDAVERATAVASDYRTCPLCETTGKAETFKPYVTNCIFGGGLLKRYQCPACDVIFGPDKMFELSPAELSQDYEWHYKVYEEGDSTEAELRAFHSLNPRRDGVYLNYGAGSWSRTVPLLREQGWNVFAYEPHGSAATDGEWLISSEAQMQHNQFDGIFSNNVLEHFRQPANDLHRMLAWLKPGAQMAHATPCFEYLFEYTRFHLFFFPGRSREVLARRAGLKIESFEVYGMFLNAVYSPA
jgi:hypothetical protein